jgi:hypothetical protein
MHTYDVSHGQNRYVRLPLQLCQRLPCLWMPQFTSKRRKLLSDTGHNMFSPLVFAPLSRHSVLFLYFYIFSDSTYVLTKTHQI